MKKLLIAALLLMAGAAHAQYACLYKGTFTPLAEGTPKTTLKTAKGESDGWYCKVQRTDGTWYWKYQHHTRLKEYTLNFDNLMAAKERVESSSNMTLAVSGEVIAGSVIPPVNTQKRYDWEELRYLGCLETNKNPGIETTFTEAQLNASNCQPPTPLVVTPPPVPTDLYDPLKKYKVAVTPYSPTIAQTYNFAGGVRTTTPSNIGVPVNSNCDCRTRTSEATPTPPKLYCAVFGVPGKVAWCTAP